MSDSSQQSDSLQHGIFQTPQAAQRLTIYVGESDRFDGKPLYEAIVLKARELGMAGATVLRGPMGFGANSRIHTVKILRLSEDLPILIEIVESPQRIAALRPHLVEMLGHHGAGGGGLVTLEEVGVIVYHPSATRGGAGGADAGG